MEREKLGICNSCQKGILQPAEVCPHCGASDSYYNLDGDLIKLIERGQLTDAMKRVMRLTGWDLKEAKDYLDYFRSGGR